jgi:hypothetical protein
LSKWLMTAQKELNTSQPFRQVSAKPPLSDGRI